MSDNKTTAPKAPPIPTVSVTRNEQSLDFVNTVVERGPAESRGKQYLAPVVNKDNLIASIIPWIGLEETASILQNILKKKAAGWYDENVEDDLTFNSTGFSDMAASFSARGESIPDLQKQIEELSAQQQDMLNSESFGTPDSITEVKKLASTITGLRAAIDNKRRMTKEEKLAKEAAEKAGAGQTVNA